MLLDTATWIWLVDGSDRLSTPAETAIETADRLLVSAISVWEVGMLVAKRRLILDRPVDSWVDEALRFPSVELASLDPAVALLSTRLPGGFASDPADQIIVATALDRGMPLVTPDRRIQAYPHVRSLW